MKILYNQRPLNKVSSRQLQFSTAELPLLYSQSNDYNACEAASIKPYNWKTSHQRTYGVLCGFDEYHKIN